MSSNTSSFVPESQLAAEVLAAVEPLRALVELLEPKDVPLPWAPEVFDAWCQAERWASAGRLLMMSRAAEAREWERSGFATPEEWMASKLGTSRGRARGDLEASGHLDDLDATKDAVKKGELSPDKAAAVADASSVNPDAEHDLLDKARKESLARTKREAERRKAEKESEKSKAERDREIRERRRARFWYGNGEGHAEIHGPIAEVKKLEAMTRRKAEQLFREHGDPQARPTRANHLFDAVISLSNTKASTGSSGGRWPVTALTMIRVDLAALKRGDVTTGELCEIGGIAVSIAEMRRLLGEGALHLVLTNGEAVIDLVNLNRQPTVAQKLAKLFEDSTCCVEGCDRCAVIEFDHRVDWARIQITELANIDRYCEHHHDKKTYENWQLVEGVGRRPMVPPGHPCHPGIAPAAAGAAAAAPNVRPVRPVPDPPPEPAGGRRDGVVRPNPDLTARVERIRRKEAEFQARLAGQTNLFDTG